MHLLLLAHCHFSHLVSSQNPTLYAANDSYIPISNVHATRRYYYDPMRVYRSPPLSIAAAPVHREDLVLASGHSVTRESDR